MRKLLYILAVTAIITAASPMGFGAIFGAKATLDSSHLLMGNVTPLHISVVTDGTEGKLDIAPDTLSSMIEYRDLNYKGSTNLDGGRKRFDYDLNIQVFDSGIHVVPQIPYIAGADTAFTDTLMLTVTVPSGVDGLSEAIDSVSIFEPKNVEWTDDLPDSVAKAVQYWPWILAGVLLVIGIIVAIILQRRKAAKIYFENEVPPYQWAMLRLNELREKRMFDKGKEREFYTQLTDILREYLYRRFNINAMEMTSSQILDMLHNDYSAHLAKPLIQRILEVADFVKFAKFSPSTDDNVHAFNDAVQFVEDTKPVVVIPTEVNGDAPADDDDDEPTELESPDEETEEKQDTNPDDK